MTTATPAPVETVLVVDDDPEIRQLLHQYLETCGLRPLLAAGGGEMRELQFHHPEMSQTTLSPLRLEECSP